METSCNGSKHSTHFLAKQLDNLCLWGRMEEKMERSYISASEAADLYITGVWLSVQFQSVGAEAEARGAGWRVHVVDDAAESQRKKAEQSFRLCWWAVCIWMSAGPSHFFFTFLASLDRPDPAHPPLLPPPRALFCASSLQGHLVFLIWSFSLCLPTNLSEISHLSLRNASTRRRFVLSFSLSAPWLEFRGDSCYTAFLEFWGPEVLWQDLCWLGFIWKPAWCQNVFSWFRHRAFFVL